MKSNDTVFDIMIDNFLNKMNKQSKPEYKKVVYDITTNEILAILPESKNEAIILKDNLELKYITNYDNIIIDKDKLYYEE